MFAGQISGQSERSWYAQCVQPYTCRHHWKQLNTQKYTTCVLHNDICYIYCMYVICYNYFVFMSESSNHWLNWFIQNTDSLTIQTKYVFIIDSLNHFLNWYVQNNDSFMGKKKVTVFMGATLGAFDLKRRCTEWSLYDIKVPRERFECIGSDCFLIAVAVLWCHTVIILQVLLQVERAYWFIHSSDLFKSLIHSGFKQNALCMTESLNHSLNWYVQNSD